MATSDDSGTYIGDWDIAQPEDSDLKSKGAAEIRKVKACVDATFPNFTGAAVTATEAELNILDGVTSTASELNILDGVTATAAELNILDGVTATAAEINVLDGATAGTAVASKALVVDANKDITLGTGDLTATVVLGTGAVRSSANVDAGYQSTTSAFLTVGYDRSVSGLSSVSLYADGAAGTTASASFQRASGTNGTLAVTNGGTGAITFNQNGSETARFDTNGFFFVDVTATPTSSNFGTQLAVGNITTFQNVPAGGIVLKAGGNTGSYFYASGDGTYGTASDIRLKENIIPANSQWDLLKQIDVVEFNWKADPESVQIGTIAQNVEKVAPELVSTDEEGIKGVNYSVLYMKAVKALQEAMARIESLEAEVAALKAG